MNATPDVTRYVTGYVPETRVIPTDPTRPEPNLTGPTANYLWSPSTTSISSVTRERFWRSVTVTPACWLWNGYLNPKGYGRFSDGRRLVMVHRFSYELVNGDVPEGMEVGHLCHVRNCVNPDHLRAMTHAENVQMSLERRGRDRAMTENERKRKWYRRNAERLRAQRRREAIEAGGWVCI